MSLIEEQLRDVAILIKLKALDDAQGRVEDLFLSQPRKG